MLVLGDAATTATVGLLITFGGIGVIVNVILVYMAIQIRGEHQQNQELLNSRRPPDA